jgi:hypothetical protein
LHLQGARLILTGLGTLLGFAGGCSMESTFTLSVACSWKNLLPVAPELLVSEPPPVAAAGALALDHVEYFDVAPGSNDTGVPALPAPCLLGPLALLNHRWEVHALVEECLGALGKADPSMQHSFDCSRRLCLCARDITVSAASTAHEVRESFASAADITYKRHKRKLKLQHRNVKTCATKQADQVLLKKCLFNVCRDESLLVSNAFRGGRSAKQTAEHIQRCMSTARHNMGARQQQQQQPLQPLSLQQVPLLQQQVEPEIWGLPQLLPPRQQQEQMANTALLVMPQQSP